MIVLLIGVPVLITAVVIALVLRARTTPGAPTQPSRYTVPAQLDRADFDRPGSPWLVAVFTSATCNSCANTWEKARLLDSTDVAVEEVEHGVRRDLHERYGVEAVPMVLVADREGVVKASFLGSPTAADLWAAVAELREPGSTPPACDHHGSAPAS